MEAQTGPGVEKQAQAAIPLKTTKLVPQVQEAVNVSENHFKRSHEGLLLPSAQAVTARGFSFKREHEYKGNKSSHRIRCLYPVRAENGPTAVLDILGEHRPENVIHLITCQEGRPADPNEQPALTYKRLEWDPSADGHHYAVDRILGHDSQDDWGLRVKVVSTNHEIRSWEPWDNVPQVILLFYHGRVRTNELPHTSSDCPPVIPRHPERSALPSAALV